MTHPDSDKTDVTSPPQPAGPAVLRLSARLPLYVLLAMIVSEITFFILDYHVNYGGMTDHGALRRLFNTAREDSFPSWASITQTTLVAVTLWFVVLTVRARGGSLLYQLGWVVVALFFCYMAADDGSKIHERLGTVYREMLEDEHKELDWPTYPWQYVFLPMFGALGLYTLVFVFWNVRDTLSRACMILAIGCLVFAVAMDAVEGLDEDHRFNIPMVIANEYENLEAWTRERFNRRAYDALRHFSKSFEECLEMLGNSLMWFVFLRYLVRMGDGVTISVVRKPSSE